MIRSMTTSESQIRPFRIEIPQQSLDDLHDRLNRTRWTTDVPGPGPEERLLGPHRGGFGGKGGQVRTGESGNDTEEHANLALSGWN